MSVTGLLDWVEAHAGWAPLAAFIVAFVESVPLIGIVLPGSALLLGIGALIGMGLVAAEPVVGAAIAGAVLGDALGFWFARAVGPRWIRSHVPQRHRRRYAQVVLLVRRWGMLAMVIARFVSPLRAVAPLVAGVGRMPQWRFQAANIVSALIWAPLLLVPGVLLAQMRWAWDQPWVLAGGAVLGLAGWWAWRRRAKP